MAENELWSRRELVRAGSAGLIGFGAAAAPLGIAASSFAAPGSGDAAPPPAPLNRFPRMVQEYFVDQVRAAERAGNDVRAALKTREDAERYVADVRAKILACFGP